MVAVKTTPRLFLKRQYHGWKDFFLLPLLSWYSSHASRAYQRDFDNVRCYCQFIGYPRSGHSLIGSLLDAHPAMLFAHELDALKFVRAGFERSQIFYLALMNSRAFTKRGRRWNGYRYVVPRQWQGAYRTLNVVGDKKGMGVARHLDLYPDSLARLRATMNLPCKFIHVVRNPFDNISTMYLKGHYTAHSLQANIELYFALAETVKRVKPHVAPDDWFELRHEDFVANPRECLAALCAFLEQDAPDDYLSECAKIVFATPRLTRDEAPWTTELKRAVEKRMADLSPFANYSFDAREYNTDTHKEKQNVRR